MIKGRIIAYLRRRRGLSQAAFAEQCHISQPYLCQIEKGRRTPSVAVLVILARSLETTPGNLIKKEEEK